MAKLLITGGTGSFGNAVATRFLKDKTVERITIFSRDEDKQHRMRYAFEDPRLHFVVGDVRDYEALRRAVCGNDYVFHAAALKHVPTGEYFPMEVVRTNVLGTENAVSAAEAENVKRFVFLSTDKAVYPINAMGISKALAEKVVGARSHACDHTTFAMVRYGNVMASRGSVIPLFVEQLLAGKPVTVTDPLMTRFLLSMDDALDLVETALTQAEQGDLFIRKAPSATIGDIAEALRRIFGANNPVDVVGVRAGEKIHETLATQLELARAQDLGDYYRIKDVARASYASFYEEGADPKKVPDADYTSETTKRLSLPETEALLRTLPFVKDALAKR